MKLLKTQNSTKVNNLERKILDGTISEVENKIPDHAKYITTQKLKKLTRENFAARLTQANLVSKTDFDNDLISFKRKILQIKQSI